MVTVVEGTYPVHHSALSKKRTVRYRREPEKLGISFYALEETNVGIVVFDKRGSIQALQTCFTEPGLNRIDIILRIPLVNEDFEVVLVNEAGKRILHTGLKTLYRGGGQRS